MSGSFSPLQRMLIADTRSRYFFVSLTKEPAMIAAVTLCTPILLIIMSVASILDMDGNSVIARLLGENKNREVRGTVNYIFLGTPFLILSNGLVHLFRSLGFMKESTIGLALGNTINIIFDFVFIV